MEFLYPEPDPERARQVNAMYRAVRTLGGYSAMARRLGVSRQAVWQYQRCPKNRVLEIETLTGVSRYDLRPDLYEVENVTTAKMG